MSRDTQFANLAKMLFEEIRRAPGTNTYVNGATVREIDRSAIEKIIAQRAYDLVVHAAWNIASVDLVRLTMEEVAAKVPDISQWNDHQTD